ncbi:MAG: hypothetical protein M1820_005897 [Bogoriella megaspora]|nr:MAG: hypothetical protein M1820_005897 [Bogoriella megaspora]
MAESQGSGVSPDVEGINYLFGFPISHSLSPLLHKTIYNALHLPWRQDFLESKDVDQFLQLTKDPKFFGASVTMPHKVSIIRHLDAIEPAAVAVGACNTIFVRNDLKTGQRRLIGANTDVVGIREAFYRNISRPDEVFHGRPALVLGGGGAARSAVYALRKSMRVSKIYLVNRDESEVEAVISHCKNNGYGEDLIHVNRLDQAESLEGPGAIVACVPDFPPATEAERIARSIFEVFLRKQFKGAILEMCYHPHPWTSIADLSRKVGWRVILGTEAMIYQGLEQDRYWTGRQISDLPEEQVRKAIDERLNRARL